MLEKYEINGERHFKSFCYYFEYNHCPQMEPYSFSKTIILETYFRYARILKTCSRIKIPVNTMSEHEIPSSTLQQKTNFSPKTVYDEVFFLKIMYIFQSWSQTQYGKII